MKIIIIAFMNFLAMSNASSLILHPRTRYCEDLTATGIPMFDCEKKTGHTLVNGVCPKASYKENCAERNAPGQPGETAMPLNGVKFLATNSISVTKDLTIGATAFGKAIEFAVTYRYATTVTNSVTLDHSPVDNGQSKFHTRWVYFPAMITTCGDTTYQEVKKTPRTREQMEDVSCIGPEKHAVNVCSTTFKLTSDNQIVSYFTQRYDNPDGTPKPWLEQTDTYKATCPCGNPACRAPMPEKCP
ncbi:hypothetical protein BGZ60DRAFT_425460 [Tricladium varicosporioides]|nr:hypothetical protein BGZ60DRAFT_425460 [Hymenoscyphus varicosporioides]